MVDLRDGHGASTDDPTAGPTDPRDPLDDGQRLSEPRAGATPRQLADAPARERTPSMADVSPGAAGQAGSLTRRLVALAAIPLAVVMLAVVAAAAFGLRADAQTDRAGEFTAAAVAQRDLGDSADRLWAGVMGVVATGVGQQVSTPAEVQALVGELRAADSAVAPADPRGAEPSGADPRGELASAARQEFARVVDIALQESAANPIELGNRLSELSAAHRVAVDATEERVVALETEAAAQRHAASRSWQVAIAVVALGFVLALVALVLVARRLHSGIGLPVARLQHALQRIRVGEPAVRSRAGGVPELAALGDDFDEVVHDAAARIEQLRRTAEWGEQSRLIFEALDLADDEEALFDVVTRALGVIDPARPVELLMTDRGPNRMEVVAANPNVGPPGEPVEGAGVCVALRRGHIAVFDSPDSINSCGLLRQRTSERLSGACVPVTLGGRPVGVIHMTGPEFHPPEPHVVDRLASLASQLGNRLGSLRMLESTRHEASTDGLTGLPNRRSLEESVARLLSEGTPFVMVLADLDKFKRLNDTYGHEVGDKALQLFAEVLRANVRGNDVVARLGGEEFVLLYPNISVEVSIEALGRIRAALARSLAGSPVPTFTCSFGVAHSSVAADGDGILRVADAGLLRAKELGGDKVVFADRELAAAIFGDDQTHGGADGDDPGRS